MATEPRAECPLLLLRLMALELWLQLLRLRQWRPSEYRVPRRVR